MTTYAVRRLLTALLLVAAPGIALGSAPAAGAATCASSAGVSVVVDYRELGGSTVTACSADGGGKSAAAIFASVGVGITYATRQPGFVCRVNGVPTSDPCVNTSPANAYWGLWWADGSKGSWTYSSSGVGSLTVPAGGSVGWSWQQDRAAGASVPPSVAPPVMKASTPTSTPSPSPTATPSPGTGTGTGTGGGSAGGSGTGSGSQPSSPSPSPTKASGGAGGSGTSPSASPSSSSPTTSSSPSGSPSESPLASESPGDSARSAAPGKAGDDKAKKGDERSEDGSDRGESPSDSPTSAGDDPSASAAESPEDSTPSASTEAADPQADGPARVPAAVTWGVLGLLAIAIAGSAVVARRRRGV